MTLCPEVQAPAFARRTWAGLLGATAILAGCGDGVPPAFNGYAEAELVYVAPTTAGVLQSVAVQRGDQVQRGQPLFAQDTDAEALMRESAAARSTRAAAVEANLRKGRRPVEIAALDAQLAQAQAALSASAAALKRQQTLVAQGFVSALQLDTLVAARDRDAARVKELQAQRQLALEAARSDEIAAAVADVKAGGFDEALARWHEGQRARTAPADAAVFDVLARPGEFVAAGAPVVVLLPPGALKVRFFIPEEQLPQARVGRRVQLGCDGCPSGLAARVRWVSPQAEFTPPVIYSVGNRSKLVFAVDAMPEPSGTAGLMKPGQPVDVRWADAQP